MNYEDMTREELLEVIGRLEPRSECEESPTVAGNEQFYQATIDSIDDLVHVVDRDLRLVVVNHTFRTWSERFHIAPGQVGQSLFAVFDFLPDRVRDEYAHVLRTGEALISQEQTLVGGQCVRTQTRKIPLFEGPQVNQVLTIVRDMTELSVAQEQLLRTHEDLERRVADRTVELQASEEKYRMLAESMSDIVTLHDMEGAFLYVSPSCEKQIGWSASDLAEEGRRKIIHPDDFDRLAVGMRDLIATGKPITLLWRCVCKHGSIKPMETRAVLVRDPQGRPYRLLLCSRDVSERRFAESLLRAQRDLGVRLSGIRSLEESLEIILDELLRIEGIDCGGIYLVNEEQTCMTLAVHEHLSEAFYESVARIDKDDPRMELVLTGQTVTDTFRGRKDRSSRIAAGEGLKGFCAIPIHFEGQVLGSVNVASKLLDQIAGPTLHSLEAITSQIGRVLAVTRAKEELALYREKMARVEQLASVGTLSATVAHELNQPLTVMQLFLQQAKRQLCAEEFSQERVLDAIEDSLSEVGKAASIVNRFRDFARKSSTVESQDVSLPAIARRLTDALTESARRRRLRLHLDVSGEIPLFSGQVVEFEQMFFVLLQNAIQAAGGPDWCDFYLGIKMAGNVVSIVAEDTCGGIADEHLDRIFEPFFTTKLRTEGTGLGLCILDRIVRKHRGHVDVQSEAGKGTCFSIRLPIGDEVKRSKKRQGVRGKGV